MWEIMEKNMGETMGHCGQRWKMYGENGRFLGGEVSPFVDSDQWGNVLTMMAEERTKPNLLLKQMQGVYVTKPSTLKVEIPLYSI